MGLRLENRFVGFFRASFLAGGQRAQFCASKKIGFSSMKPKGLTAEKRNFEKPKMKEEPTMLMKTKGHFWEPTVSMKINDLSWISHDLYGNKGCLPGIRGIVAGDEKRATKMKISTNEPSISLKTKRVIY